MGQEKQKKGKQRKWKVKVKTVVSLLNPETILKFCFLHIPSLHKLDLDHKAAKCTPFK